MRWTERLKLRPSEQRNIDKPGDWQQQPYPFIYGQFDATLFPSADWRECVLESLQGARCGAGRPTTSTATTIRWSSRSTAACCRRAASGPSATRSW